MRKLQNHLYYYNIRYSEPRRYFKKAIGRAKVFRSAKILFIIASQPKNQLQKKKI